MTRLNTYRFRRSLFIIPLDFIKLHLLKTNYLAITYNHIRNALLQYSLIYINKLQFVENLELKLVHLIIKINFLKNRKYQKILFISTLNCLFLQITLELMSCAQKKQSSNLNIENTQYYK